jgi:phenylacetate-CoA ligase
MIRKTIDKIIDISYAFRGIQLYKSHLNNSCFLSVDVVRENQFSSLKKLLIESNKNVPYYKKLFQKIGFEPETNFNSLEDMLKIPILKKEVVRANREEFINKKYENSALEFKTSGSSGNPFSALISPKHWIIEQGVVWRHWKWAGYNFRDKMAIVRSHTPKNENELIKVDKIRNFYYYSPFHLTDENIKMYLNHMIDENIVFLRGYPSSLLSLANYVNKTDCDIPNIKGMLTASEVLTDEDRKIIESAFKAKISNHYGLAEQIVMFGDCEKHEGLHNYDEYGYLELIDTEDENIKKIIGTNLNNLAMPLIRYDTGDLAEVSEQSCSCGRSSQVIKNVIGRHDSQIVTPEGNKIPSVNFYTMFEYYPVESWQMIQHTIDKVEVILQGDNLENKKDELYLKLKEDLSFRLPQSISFEMSIHKSFYKVGEGKKNPFISLVK